LPKGRIEKVVRGRAGQEKEGGNGFSCGDEISSRDMSRAGRGRKV